AVAALSNRESIAITGIGQINRSHILSGLHRDVDRPMILLCQDDLAARRLQEELKSFLGDKEGILSWKLDGLTIVLTYKNGVLEQAITRGNGEIGEDVTHNARVFSNLPVSIPFKGELVLRGEGVIPYSAFYRINEELEEDEQYKNPRNLCSGTVRQLNSEIAAKRNVKFFAFTLVSAEGKEISDSKSENMDWLAELGFDVVEHVMVTAETVAAEVENFRNKIEDNDIASDGLVMTFDSISYSQSLGRTSKFPKDSIAFKWADEMAETTLREIEWSTSRTGLMNPVAIFDPVELEGSTVSRASVHNVSILKELKLSIGDKIKVYKANMIIPQIAENLTGDVSTAEIPAKCFVCGGETEVRKLRDGEALYCTNPNCSAQRIQALSHFVSRDAMNMEGLSEETLKKFLEKGFVENYPDIFRLEEHKDAITSMEGFGEKSYNNLIASIEKAKDVELPNFLYALGINHVGLRNAKLLCANFDFDLETIKQATEEELIQVEGFGEIIAHSIAYYFRQEEHLALLADALQYLRIKETEQTAAADSPLMGLTFVVTGDLEQFANRKELQALIEQGGGKVTGSVTKKTNFLINNDIHSASSKNKKAAELGIPILSEQDFINKFMK
ncbi:MAG: NAD-dependent DNA ligase LigA, partial [Anaerotignum sp.]|nr:NAD-dependent DNA ligase LigA [Anaerotignum sp.]